MKNYLTVAIRALLRQPGYSLINILGLSLGIVVCLLVGLYVRLEFSFDDYHPKGERVYKLIRETRREDGGADFNRGIQGPLPPAIAEDFAQVESAIRTRSRQTYFRHGETILQPNFMVVDPGFLDAFDFPLLRGGTESLSSTSNAVLMTESMARDFFGNTDPIGQVIHTDYKYFVGDYVVAGILADHPTNTDFEFDILTQSVHTGYSMQHTWSEWRPESSWRPVQSFIVMNPGTNAESMQDGLARMVARRYGEDYASRYRYHLQPLERQHLYSTREYGLWSSGDIDYVNTMILAGAFILLIAAINYINLSTARATARAHEVGLRKTVGALRAQLIRQFLGEAVVSALIATAIAVELFFVVEPTVSAFLRRDLSPPTETLFVGALILPVVGLLIGGAAGIYPALVLSGFQVVRAIKGAGTTGTGGSRLRKGLVVAQFAISIGLITGMWIVRDQTEFMRTKHLGFDSEQVVMTSLLTALPLQPKWVEVKARFLSHPDILGASASSTFIGLRTDYWSVRPEGFVDSDWHVSGMSVDEDFVPLFNLGLALGRNLPDYVTENSETAVLINQSAVDALGWDDPIGKQIHWEFMDNSYRATVYGVVEDFHHQSLRSGVEPLLLAKTPQRFRSMAFKISGNDVPGTLAFIEDQWTSLRQDVPFTYQFLDDALERQYRQEERVAQIFQVLAGVAVFVACLGLVGLASYAVQQRTREIGVRKAVGATEGRIVTMLTGEFLVLVAVAGVVTWPVTYYLSRSWLEGFAYRVEPEPFTFVGATLAGLAVAILAIGWQAVRAARQDPVVALRYE